MNQVFEKEDRPIDWGDQHAHFWSCWGLTLLSLGYGATVVALWAITREYYQVKRTMEKVIQKQPTYAQVIEQLDFWKRDLKFSYAGIGVALAIIIPIHIWVF